MHHALMVLRLKTREGRQFTYKLGHVEHCRTIIIAPRNRTGYHESHRSHFRAQWLQEGLTSKLKQNNSIPLYSTYTPWALKHGAGRMVNMGNMGNMTRHAKALSMKMKQAIQRQMRLSAPYSPCSKMEGCWLYMNVRIAIKTVISFGPCIILTNIITIPWYSYFSDVGVNIWK